MELVVNLTEQVNQTLTMLIDWDRTRIKHEQAMNDMQTRQNETAALLQTCQASDESKSNAITQMDQTISECQTRADMIDKKMVDLEQKNSTCVKSVSMLKRIVIAINNNIH